MTSPSAAALNVSHFPAISSLSAGMQSLPAVQFELSPPGAPCSRIVFDYSASLVCNFSDGTSRSGVNLFPGGISSNNLGQTELRGTIRASCRFSVEGWTFGTVASCQIRVIIPVLAISALTPSFSVEAGPAVSGYLIGFLPSQVSGASPHFELQFKWRPLRCSAAVRFLQQSCHKVSIFIFAIGFSFWHGDSL